MKSKHNMKRFLFVSLLLTLFLASSAQVKLSFNPEKGKKYEYKVEMLQNIDTEVMGQSVAIEMLVGGTYWMELIKKTEEELHMQTTYKDFSMAVKVPMQNISYDSKQVDENSSDTMHKAMAGIFDSLIDKSFIIVFGTDGTVKSVEGMDAILEDMMKSIDNSGNEAMKITISQQFNDESIRKSFEQLTDFYPKEAVKVGETWTRTNFMDIGTGSQDIQINSNYKLIELKENVAKIEIVGDIDMDIEGGKMEGMQTGTLLIDAISGMPISSDIMQDSGGTISTQGIDVHMKAKSAVKNSVRIVE